MVRNIAIVGHGNCGKTSLAEAMLYTAGKISRLGKVDDGNSAMDYEDEEIHRNISINSSFHNYNWKKHDIYLIDTPGDDNFLNETLFATHVCDSALFVIGAVLGVKGQTIKFANMVAERNLPNMIVINKMDRERADFSRTLAEIRASLPVKPVVLHLPIGAEDKFRGIVDIISGKAYLFDEGNKGTLKETAVPEDLADEVSLYRESLMENVAETDDDLIEKFLEEGELTTEEIMKGLRAGVAKASLTRSVSVRLFLTKELPPCLTVSICSCLPPLSGQPRSASCPETVKLLKENPWPINLSPLWFLRRWPTPMPDA